MALSPEERKALRRLLMKDFADEQPTSGVDDDDLPKQTRKAAGEQLTNGLGMTLEDVDDLLAGEIGRIDQIAALYDPEGGDDSRSCATCRFFFGPFHGEGPGHCMLVCGKIMPGGISEGYMPASDAIPIVKVVSGFGDWPQWMPTGRKVRKFAVHRDRASGRVVARFESTVSGAAWGTELVVERNDPDFENLTSIPAKPLEGLDHSRWLTKKSTDRHELVDRGSYHVGVVADDVIEIRLTKSKLLGVGDYCLSRGPGGRWKFTARADEGSIADVYTPMGYIYKRAPDREFPSGTGRILWPRDSMDFARGHDEIDASAIAQAPYRVLKKDSEKRYTLGVAYPAGDVDVHGEFAEASELEKAAWSYVARRGGVGLMHKNGTDNSGKVVESYIYRGPEWRLEGQVVKSGDWLLGVIWTEHAWSLIKSGKIRGYSIQGFADREAT